MRMQVMTIPLRILNSTEHTDNENTDHTSNENVDNIQYGNVKDGRDHDDNQGQFCYITGDSSDALQT